MDYDLQCVLCWLFFLHGGIMNVLHGYQCEIVIVVLGLWVNMNVRVFFNFVSSILMLYQQL